MSFSKIRKITYRFPEAHKLFIKKWREIFIELFMGVTWPFVVRVKNYERNESFSNSSGSQTVKQKKAGKLF
jgi:hypothetical protein